MRVLPACVHVFMLDACRNHRRTSEFPVTPVTDCGESLYGFRNPNLCPLQEQPVLSTFELALQPCYECSGTPLTLIPRRQRQAGLCELEASLGYILRLYFIYIYLFLIPPILGVCVWWVFGWAWVRTPQWIAKGKPDFSSLSAAHLMLHHSFQSFHFSLAAVRRWPCELGCMAEDL